MYYIFVRNGTYGTGSRRIISDKPESPRKDFGLSESLSELGFRRQYGSMTNAEFARMNREIAANGFCEFEDSAKP